MEQALLRLAADYDSARESLRSWRGKLVKLAVRQQNTRSAAEREAMFLEDCFGHSPSSILPFYAGPMDDSSKEAARSELQHNCALLRRRGGRLRVADLRAEIDKMMRQIEVQHEELTREEEELSRLREGEVEARKREDEVYSELIARVHAISDEFDELRRQNKAKKWQLEKLESANADLRNCVEQARAAIERSNTAVESLRKDATAIDERKRKAEERLGGLGVLESDIERLKEENAKLREREEQAGDALAEVEAEVAKKRSEVVRVMEEIRRAEAQLGVVPVESPKRAAKLTPKRDSIVAKYNREMSELL